MFDAPNSIIDEVGQISKYKNIGQNNQHSHFMILLEPSSMTFLSQAASKANFPRSSADLTRYRQN